MKPNLKIFITSAIITTIIICFNKFIELIELLVKSIIPLIKYIYDLIISDICFISLSILSLFLIVYYFVNKIYLSIKELKKIDKKIKGLDHKSKIEIHKQRIDFHFKIFSVLNITFAILWYLYKSFHNNTTFYIIMLIIISLISLGILHSIYKNHKEIYKNYIDKQKKDNF